MLKSTGIEYELFVKQIYGSILAAEEFAAFKNIQLEHSKVIRDREGNDRQFDIYWEYEIGGVVIKTVIECKDYNSNVSIDKIDGLIGKTAALPHINKKIFATKKGYASGAKNKAIKNGIDLIVVREHGDDDWYDKEGNPYIRGIDVNIVVMNPPELKKFEPYLKDQGNKALAKELNEKFQHWNWEQLRIVTKNKTFGLGEYMDAAAIDQEDGLIECEENDVVLKYEDDTIDLRLLKIAFLKKKPHQETIKIDMSESILGVVEYIEKDKKLVINKDGRIYKE